MECFSLDIVRKCNMKVSNILKNLCRKTKKLFQQTAELSAEKITAADLKFASMQGSVTIGANGTNWATLTCPSGRRILAPCGFYWYGQMNTSCVAYAYRLVSDTEIQFAIRNYSSSQAVLTLDTTYLYVDVGGVTHSFIDFIASLLNKGVVMA